MVRRLSAALTIAVLILTRAGLALAPPAHAQIVPTPTQACSANQSGSVVVTFAWPDTGGRESRLHLSLFNNGFLDGTFLEAGPFASGTDAFSWKGILPGLPHFYRVEVRDPQGWSLHTQGAFVSALCDSPAGAPRGVVQVCSAALPGQVQATLSWAPGLGSPGGQWVDLTTAGPDFAPGTFLGTGPFPSAASSLIWDGLPPGVRHWWRVNTFSGGQWHVSASGSFTTGLCEGLAPGAAPVGAGLATLGERLQAEIAAAGINAAVAVTDLQTGESISVAGDDVRLPGCTINFFVLLSVVLDLQIGRYPEAQVGELIAATVWSSNPHTARQLLAWTGMGDLGVGVAKVNDLLRSLGLQHSLYDHPPAYMPSFSLYGASNALTANDMNRALTLFYQGQIVVPYWRDYLLAKLRVVKPGLNYLIPAGVSGGLVAHKNGFFSGSMGWIDNDAGIVEFDVGGVRRAYAISFFTQQSLGKYADIPLGQTVSRLTWEYFQAKYRSP
jgi:hypothetical protein